jgi:hypothetical protein
MNEPKATRHCEVNEEKRGIVPADFLSASSSPHPLISSSPHLLIPSSPHRRWWAVGLAVAILLGVVLRLVWVMDMEYKGDEIWTFEQTQHVGVDRPFPWFGMGSSTGMPNPGLSVWFFLFLSKAFALQDPTSLARAVQVSSILAIVLLVAFALRCVSRMQREPWLWAAALSAVNPLTVLIHRKIWPPSVLPLFTLAMLLGWWYRDRRWGALVWGLVGALLGQIHMAGFFFAAGFCAWALLFDQRRVCWWSWLVGSCLGALPLIPWVVYLTTHAGQHPLTADTWGPVLEFRFYAQWFTQPFGLGLDYSLKRDFADFLRYPLLGGQPTYVVAVLHVGLVALAVVILGRACYHLWRQRARLGTLWAGKDSGTAFTQNAALWGFGLLLTASAVLIHRHYVVVAFPLPFVWLARQALLASARTPRSLRLGRTLLLSLCCGQFLVSASFLGYIHANQRPIQGDYGIPYGAQAMRSAGTPPARHLGATRRQLKPEWTRL